jgi:putative ATP-dependent endonuclease of the OLD family
MILRRARVQNFRAIRDLEVEFGPHTAMLGGNGAGKSTILRAIDRFYASNSNVDSDDFFGRQTDVPIRITLTFADFSTDEIERFGNRIENGEMSVTRVFEYGAVKNSGRYYGIARQYPPFTEIRAIASAVERRQRFNELAANLKIKSAKSAAEVDLYMKEWESENSSECVLTEDDGQFFGFANVGRGNLRKSTSFVFIPALRDAHAESLDSRGAAISQLMELVVRSAIQRRSDIKSFQERISAEYNELMDPARLPELKGLSQELSDTLQFFYAEADVDLQWKTSEGISIPMPNANVLLSEDGFGGPVDRKGHGLQRAFIFALLQHLAKAGSVNTPSVEDAGTNNGEHSQATILSKTAQLDMSGLILAIEEPELYQHPTKQRHLAKVLNQLSQGVVPGVASRTQVIFASHSPLFVSIDRFDEVKIVRRIEMEGRNVKEVRCFSSNLEAIVNDLEAAYEVRPGTYSVTGLRGRLHIIGPEMSEGFFAEKVVLVEGVSDRAALMAAAQLNGVDLEAQNIALLCVDGKSKMDRPAAIFNRLNIPVYAIFDCDVRQNDRSNIKANRAIQRLMGATVPVDAATCVSYHFACFEEDLEHQIKQDVGTNIFDIEVKSVQEKYSIQRDDVLKTPAAMLEVLLSMDKMGVRSTTLDCIVAAIVKLGCL